jgi:lipopolysaccharide export system ATP-binding protein
MNEHAAALLRAEGVTVVKSGRVIVRDVSVTVPAGEVLGVLGPSGAGKSTFFGALAGEEAMASGKVEMGGEDVSTLPLWKRSRKGLGYIPQSPSVLWELSVEENLTTFFQVVRRAKPPRADVEEMASRVDLAGKLGVNAGALSGGERRRLELARALTAKPRVLLCDEPFAGVDPKGAAHLGELLAEQAKGGVAVLLADHHVDEALRVCTKAMLLLDGSVAVVAEPAAFREDPLVVGRYLGTLETRGSRM